MGEEYKTQVEEIKNEAHTTFKKRLGRIFLNGFILISLGYIVVEGLKGFTYVSLITYFFLLVLVFVYAFFSIRTIITSIRFYPEQKKIEIIINRYNREKTFICNSKEIHISVLQDLGSKTEAWNLQILKNGKKLIVQSDTAGWTKDLFLQIEKKHRQILKSTSRVTSQTLPRSSNK